MSKNKSRKRVYVDDDEDDDDETEDDDRSYLKSSKTKSKQGKKSKLTFKKKFKYYLTMLITYCREYKLASDISEDAIVDFVVFALKEAKFVFTNELRELQETTFTVMKLGDTRAKISDDPIKIFNKKLTRNLLSHNDFGCSTGDEYDKFNFIIDVNYFLIQTYAKTNKMHGSINFNKDFNTIYVKCNEEDDSMKQSIILITILSILHMLCHLDVQFRNQNKNVLRDENLLKCSIFYRLADL